LPQTADFAVSFFFFVTLQALLTNNATVKVVDKTDRSTSFTRLIVVLDMASFQMFLASC